MPIIQGPEHVWERTADAVKWTITPSERETETVYELRIDCGMGIMRLHYFTEAEMKGLRATLVEQFP